MSNQHNTPSKRTLNSASYKLLLAIKKYMDCLQDDPSYDEVLFVYEPLPGIYALIGNCRKDDVTQTWGKDGAYLSVSFYEEEDETARQLLERFRQRSYFRLFTPYSVAEGDDRPFDELAPNELLFYAYVGYDALDVCRIILAILNDVFGANIDDVQFGTQIVMYPEPKRERRRINFKLIGKTIAWLMGLAVFTYIAWWIVCG